MLFSQIIAIDIAKHSKHSACVKNADILMMKQVTTVKIML
jgi:hypothetical protein